MRRENKKSGKSISKIILLKGFYIFYLRLFIPASITAIIIALADLALGGRNFLPLTGYTYFLLAAAYQFILYDFMNPGQYYFYNNIGFSRLMLWILNLSISFIIYVILLAI